MMLNRWSGLAVFAALAATAASEAREQHFDFESGQVPAEFLFDGQPWAIDDEHAATGTYSLHSGSLPYNAHTDAILTVESAVPLGVDFDLRLGSRGNLRVLVDGVEVRYLYGSGWQHGHVDVPAGMRELRFRYASSICCMGPGIGAWLDDVVISPLPRAEYALSVDWTHTDMDWGGAPGRRGLVAHDVDRDGVQEIIATLNSGDATFWMVATWNGSSLERQFVSAPYTDANEGWGDAIVDIDVYVDSGEAFVAVTTPGQVEHFRADDRRLSHVVPLPFRVVDAELTDLDLDGAPEMVLLQDVDTNERKIAAIDAADGSVLWQLDHTAAWDVEIADFDASPGLELAVSGSPWLGRAFGFYSATGELIWQPEIPFDLPLVRANVDDDVHADLLVETSEENLVAIDVAERATLWSVPLSNGPRLLGARDVDADGRDEVFVQETAINELAIFSIDDGALLEVHAISLEGGRIDRVALADFGLSTGPSIIFGAGASDPDLGALMVATLDEPTPVWSGVGGYEVGDAPRVADINDDGAMELVYLSHKGITVVSAHDFGAVAEIQEPAVPARWSGLDVTQLDADAPLEILVTRYDDNGSEAFLETIDGATGASQGVVEIDSTSLRSPLFPRVTQGDEVVVVQSYNLARVLPESGAVVDEVELPEHSEVQVVPGGQAAVALNYEGIHLIDPSTGSMSLHEIEDAYSHFADAQGTLVSRSDGVYAFDGEGGPVNVYPTESPALHAWRTYVGGRSVVFASTEGGQLEAFDGETAARVLSAEAAFADLGIRGRVAHHTNDDGTATMWVVSRHGVHRAIVRRLPFPIFTHGFEPQETP